MWIRTEDCTGCGACAAVCPKACIAMKPDSEGFLYPQIDTTRCVNCHRCEQVCPVHQGVLLFDETKAVAAQNQNDSIRQSSSSGGVFTALAERILEDGGVVCAAAYDDKFAVVHKITNQAERLAAFRGAKYAQSHSGHLFGEIKTLLAADTPVLFVGTPCQCAGLRSYLGKKPENLLLVDMVCHGVPSPDVWQRYLDLRRSTNGEISAINLRNKSTGWSRYAYSVEICHENGTVYSVPQGQDPFMRGFTSDLYLRPSCSRCSFKGYERCTDLTLGDCWGIWELMPEFDDNQGTSLLLIHSTKGQEMWQSIQDDFRHVELDKESAVRYNPSTLTSSTAHPKREVFFSRLDGEPVDWLIQDCLTVPQKTGLLRRILRRLRG